jgi:hypothetical protein
MPEIPFADFGLKWFEDILGQVKRWFTEQLRNGVQQMEDAFFGTPLPDGSGTGLVFQPPAPSNEPWRSIYDATVGGETMLFGLLVLFLTVQGRHFARIFDIGSAYESRRVTRSAWLGAVLIIAWYWLGVLVLYFVDGLTVGLLPDVSAVASALISLLPVSLANPLLTVIMAGLGGISVIALQAVFFIRRVLLFVYLYGMPIGFGLAFGGIPVLSRIAARLCKQFLPLAVLPIPAAVLFRGYDLLFAGDTLVINPVTAFLNYLVVVSLPLLALYVTWKAFRYASPLTTRLLERGAGVAVTAGAVAGAATAGGTRAAVTAARFGPRAGAIEAGARRLADDEDDTSQSDPRTDQDRITRDDGGIARYRRRENDPGYY